MKTKSKPAAGLIHQSASNLPAALKKEIPFSKQIKKWRKAAKLTIPKAAAALGVKVRAYENWEESINEPAGDNLRKVLAKLNLLNYEPLAGKKLRALRNNLALTQRQAAKKAGISQSFYSKLERSQQRCPDDVLNKLAA